MRSPFMRTPFVRTPFAREARTARCAPGRPAPPHGTRPWPMSAGLVPSPMSRSTVAVWSAASDRTHSSRAAITHASSCPLDAPEPLALAPDVDDEMVGGGADAGPDDLADVDPEQVGAGRVRPATSLLGGGL